MKIFVTGGTGFIGTHFLRSALTEGHSVTALRRLGSQPRLALAHEPRWLEVSMDKLEAKHFAGHEVLVHLAAHSANAPYDTLENCLHWNVTIAMRMAAKAHKGGISTFLVAGSCFEYGLSGERYDFIPTDAPVEPTQSYPISKAAASIAWAGFAREKQASVSILRIFQVYGEGEPSGRLWPSIRAAALSGKDYALTPGEQVRDFIPVQEVARQFVDALKHSAPPGKPMISHIGTGHPQTVAEFASTIWRESRASGRLLIGQLPYRENEVMRFVPRIERNAE